MKGRSFEILRLVSTILSETAAAAEKARSATPAAFDKRRMAPELLVMLHTADELVAFFDPPIDPMEYHNVPPSMMEWEDEPHLVVRATYPYTSSSDQHVTRCSAPLTASMKSSAKPPAAT